MMAGPDPGHHRNEPQRRGSAACIEHFGQTGSIRDLYRHHGIDAKAIAAAAEMIAPGRPIPAFAGDGINTSPRLRGEADSRSERVRGRGSVGPGERTPPGGG
ncbi:MAG TPA: hypothetical protein VF601_21040, partial [Beijerinckiaceae bacterium]